MNSTDARENYIGVSVAEDAISEKSVRKTDAHRNSKSTTTKIKARASDLLHQSARRQGYRRRNSPLVVSRGRGSLAGRGSQNGVGRIDRPGVDHEPQHTASGSDLWTKQRQDGGDQ